MRLPLLLAAVLFFASAVARTADAQAPAPESQALTANDLAEELGVHWWTIKLPDNLTAGDTISVELVSDKGNKLPGGVEIGVPKGGGGGTIRMFCRVESGELKVSIRVPMGPPWGGTVCSGSFSAETFRALSHASTGWSFNGSVVKENGSIMKVGDYLMVFDLASNSALYLDNRLREGQFGLKLVIEPRN